MTRFVPWHAPSRIIQACGTALMIVALAADDAAVRAQPPVLDHLLCYRGPSGPASPVPVTLEDQFDAAAGRSAQGVVTEASRFCNPVDKNGEGIFDPDAHLTWYTFAADAPGPVPSQVTVRNQFGEQVLQLGGPDTLAVPTQKLAPGSHDFPADLDHFKCYDASGDPIGLEVTLEDQFRNMTALVAAPTKLCNPAKKTHNGLFDIKHPEAHLVCYSLDQVSPFIGSVSIRNQFEEGLTFDATTPATLCVPSEKQEPRLDHFWCYLSQGPPAGADIQLRDQFDTGGAFADETVDIPFRFCNPVAKTHAGTTTPITLPDNHLTFYEFEVDHDVFIPWFVDVDNQFGVQRLKVYATIGIAVPTQKDPHGPPFGLDHFKCYPAVGTPLTAVVDLQDQFHGAPVSVQVLEPVALCNPMEKIHGATLTPILHPEDHLVCYRAENGEPPRILSLSDQFGSTAMATGSARELCVPSAKTLIPAPFSLALAPATAVNTVGEQHCVSATLADANANPVAGPTVRFAVTGANSTSGSGTTDANGEATFCYTGASPGSDTISAYADLNDDNLQHTPPEPAALAQKTWLATAMAAAADSFLRGAARNVNEGANPRLLVEGRRPTRAVVAFDLSPAPPDPMRVRLVLNIAEPLTDWSRDGSTVIVRRLGVGPTPFAEGNGALFGLRGRARTRGAGPGTTWRCETDAEIGNRKMDCALDWNGGLLMARPPAGAGVLHQDGMTGAVAWDVTADVLAALDEGATSIAWLVKKEFERGEGTRAQRRGRALYYSREGAGAAGDGGLGPRLVFE